MTWFVWAVVAFYLIVGAVRDVQAARWRRERLERLRRLGGRS